jgi:hypothetical protein
MMWRPRQGKNVLRKIRRQMTKDYVLHPLLAKPRGSSPPMR